MQNPFDNDMTNQANVYLAKLDSQVQDDSIEDITDYEGIQDIDRQVNGQFAVTVNGKKVDSRLIPMN